jgi:hypothetical protein
MELSGNIKSSSGGVLCANHSSLEHFLIVNSYSSRPIFVGLSSIGRCVSHLIQICVDIFSLSSLVTVCCNGSRLKL